MLVRVAVERAACAWTTRLITCRPSGDQKWTKGSKQCFVSVCTLLPQPLGSRDRRARPVASCETSRYPVRPDGSAKHPKPAISSIAAVSQRQQTAYSTQCRSPTCSADGPGMCQCLVYHCSMHLTLCQRANALRAQGFTAENSPELAKIYQYLAQLQPQIQQREFFTSRSHLVSLFILPCIFSF